MEEYEGFEGEILITVRGWWYKIQTLDFCIITDVLLSGESSFCPSINFKGGSPLSTDGKITWSQLSACNNWLHEKCHCIYSCTNELHI